MLKFLGYVCSKLNELEVIEEMYHFSLIIHENLIKEVAEIFNGEHIKENLRFLEGLLYEE